MIRRLILSKAENTLKIQAITLKGSQGHERV